MDPIETSQSFGFVDWFLFILFAIIGIQILALVFCIFVDLMCGTHCIRWFCSLYRDKNDD